MHQLKVVLFSGGRGSGALTRLLVSNSSVSLTLAINGYDDGASTGEVRRFLRDSLGPSDFRKNASRVASELRSCPAALLELLDFRFPVGSDEVSARQALADVAASAPATRSDVARIAARIGAKDRDRVSGALTRFLEAVHESGEPFHFSDCSLGNLVFAGLYLECARHFNRAVDHYSTLVGLSCGLIENVTDGTNAWLVGRDEAGRFVASEEEMVDLAQPRRLKDIFLIDRPLTNRERADLADARERAADLLESHAVFPALNARLRNKIATADLIIYAPGTQHSSLFPSYMTPGLGEAIASNLAAIKLLITNIQSDAEISGSSATDLINRAVFYLKQKGRAAFPTPTLISHFLLNDPGRAEAAAPYVPLGPVDGIEDPRLVRIGNYEEGLTGRHDAARVLGPFLDSIASRDRRQRVAVLLHDAGSTNKVVQTLLEMVRGGISRLPLDVTVFCAGSDALDETFVMSLPFDVTWLRDAEPTLVAAAHGRAFDYVALFESSGMYRGQDLVALLSHLTVGRLDAVWGSRRLSVRDIQESYRMRYRRNLTLGAISYVGSHALSLAYLFLYGRYISDTLSGVRAVRAADALEPGVDLGERRINHLLLTHLLRRKADILEMPVQFLPLSPERVRRTSPLDGLQALGTMVWRRFSRRRPTAERVAASGVREKASSAARSSR